MSDEAALLAAIIAEPDDDTPRLAYADWLDEQGGESNGARAEYIRLEIERARVGHTLSPEWKEREKQSQALIRKHSQEWFPVVYGKRNLLRGATASVDNRRGFPYYVYAHNPARVVEVGDKLFGSLPLTDLILNNVDSESLAGLLQKPWLSHLRYIQLAGYDIPPTDWAPVADCPHLAELTELVFCGGKIDAAGAERFASGNPCPKLAQLDLGAKVGNETLAKLFAGKAFTGLRELKLSSNKGDFGLKGIEAVAASKALAWLKAFDLPWHPIQKLMPALMKATFWDGLESLEMLRCGLTEKDVATLVRKPPPLRVLDLDDNKIGTKGARVLAESPIMATLTKLDLSRTEIGDEGVAAIVNSPQARNLQSLELSSCNLSPVAITAIAESPHLANLRELWLSSDALDLKGARALAASPHLGGLTMLWAGGGLTAAARKALKERFGDHVRF